MSGAEAPPSTVGWENLARGAANLGVDDEEDVELRRELLSFRLGESPYAIPVERVREIVRMREITIVPRMPSWVLGVVALRGEVVQVVDLRMRLGLAPCEPSRRSRIIVLHGDDEAVTAILVDAVEAVLRIPEDSVSPASGSELGAVTELCEHGGEFVSLIDVDRVLEFCAGRS